MGKRKSQRAGTEAGSLALYRNVGTRQRRALILPRFLAQEAEDKRLLGSSFDRAFEIVNKWAELETKGHLEKKETALDANFLFEFFGEALGYKTSTESPESWQLERNYWVPKAGTADGALGDFSRDTSSPVAVIELKDKNVDLDHDRFNGRTPVQQCWDYLNALPECPWGIVSNFVKIRLYHRKKGTTAYQEFELQGLRRIEDFKQFYYLFEIGGLLRPGLAQAPRARTLLERTENRQREVGNQLYETYSDNRLRLIEHLQSDHGKSLDVAIHIAQKILDRIIFVAFCEDRDLLPERCIEGAYKTIPPFTKVTNPRWQNFLNLFHAIDKGHESLALSTGYNGGLFRHDPEVDDLQLSDEWTNFFNTVGGYDFRDEVNVEVLGHLFERSVGELERIRQSGLFSAGTSANGDVGEPAMLKSPERKRSGIYYTPPDFTYFLVNETVTALAESRLSDLRGTHKLTKADLDAGQPSEGLAAYWQEAVTTVRQIKVCDPACGSGAFLIQAYEVLEDVYQTIADNLRKCDERAGASLIGMISEFILADNLYGVDLSEQSVEITQLALWIRSARRGRSLADLSQNIVRGNSLVTDPVVDARALDWKTTFRTVFARPATGFDCVIGNPPWERLKLQEREFFAFSAPKIANAVSAARRRELIGRLQTENKSLFERYEAAKESADRTLTHVRRSGEFPLTAKGDINTYMLFAELATKLVAPTGRIGLLVPSGIATDNTTREFFESLMSSKRLISLHDFENKAPVFPDVHRSFKFCTLVFGGTAVTTPAADFVFFARRMSDLDDKNRHIPLSSKDIALLNPNTRTSPIFRSRRDAELTKAVYRRVPVLIDESRGDGGNPWGIRFVTMFHQTNDAELFHAPEQLKKLGFQLHGNRWTKGKQTFLPLYEAKMIQAYDHRAASVKIEAGNWVRQGQTEDTSLVEHQNPEFVVQPRWWVEDKEVTKVRGQQGQPGYLSFKDVTSPTNQRTMIAALIPEVAVVNSAPLMLTGVGISPRLLCCLLGNLNSIALDFIARQKVGGLHLNFFIVNQFPIFHPDHYSQHCPWRKRQTLEKWISDRVLLLTCTANDLIPFAEAASFAPSMHRWKPAERAETMAELDAAFFLLYGIGRDDVEYILGTFSSLADTEHEALGVLPQATAILRAYDQMAGLAAQG